MASRRVEAPFNEQLVELIVQAKLYYFRETTIVKIRYLVKSSPWSLTHGAAAALLLLLLLINPKLGTCEALRKNVHRRPDFFLKHAVKAIGGESKLAGTRLQDAGVTYRPPIVNMNYLGGLVMWKPIHLYFVWYGKWSAAEKYLIRIVSNSLTPKKRIRQYPNLSNLWSIVTEYYQELPLEGRKYATDNVSIAGEIDDDYSFGRNISGDLDPLKIILSHLGHGLPSDIEQGVYFLFTSADVAFSGAGYCGYHGNECVDPTRYGTPFCNDYLNNVIYSFVPLPSVDNGLIIDCNIFRTTPTSGGLRGRPPNHLVSPHGALDSMITTFLHELLETAVDPIWFLKPAWRFNRSENSEMADMCSYEFIAGDWFYCGLWSVYPDFPDDGNCLSFIDHNTALTDPKAHTTFNFYGIDDSRFIAQLMWSLSNKGCASQPEESCPRKTVVIRKSKGTIQRGLFFMGVGLQSYAPGQDCSWKIEVRGARCIHFYFEKIALGYDDLDFVTVLTQNNVIKKQVTGFGKNIKVKVSGDEATIRFVTYGSRSPYPSSAGFIMHYEAGNIGGRQLAEKKRVPTLAWDNPNLISTRMGPTTTTNTLTSCSTNTENPVSE